MDSEKISYALDRTRGSIVKKYGSDNDSASYAARTVDFIEEWTQLSGRDWNATEDDLKASCKAYCKSRHKEEQRSGILGTILLFVVVKLIADWIVNRFFYHASEV
jgi:hypothetical protein